MSAECSAENILPGYKQTEVGVIPDDWNSICYADYLNIISGLGFKKAEYCDVGIRLLRIDNVSYGQISWDSIAYLPIQYIEKFPNLVLSEGDILLALNRPITNNQLKLARLDAEDSPAILYQRVGKIGVTNSKLDKRFAYFVLRKFIRKFVEESSVGSDQPFISTTALKKIHIPLPTTLAEQESIAEALSDTDAFIESLEQLIAKKRQFKQGAMQELLTGKRRLPGFGEGKGYKQTEMGEIPEDWLVNTIGELCSCFSGGTPSTSNPCYYGGNIAWITSGDLNNIRIKEVEGRITEEGLVNSSAKIVKEGTLLLALYGATAGVSAVTEIRAAINQAVLAILPKQLDTEYIFQLLRLRKDFYILTFTQGGQPNFSGEIVKSFIIPIPPTKAEQEAIATTLSDMDSEITVLEEKLVKAHQIKQGMMQELLTGRIRLI